MIAATPSDEAPANPSVSGADPQGREVIGRSCGRRAPSAMPRPGSTSGSASTAPGYGQAPAWTGPCAYALAPWGSDRRPGR